MGNKLNLLNIGVIALCSLFGISKSIPARSSFMDYNNDKPHLLNSFNINAHTKRLQALEQPERKSPLGAPLHQQSQRQWFNPNTNAQFGLGGRQYPQQNEYDPPAPNGYYDSYENPPRGRGGEEPASPQRPFYQRQFNPYNEQQARQTDAPGPGPQPQSQQYNPNGYEYDSYSNGNNGPNNGFVGAGAGGYGADEPLSMMMPVMAPIRRMYHVYEDNVRGFAKRFRNMVYYPMKMMG